MSISNHRVTLVGAGPGDPELITLKGMKALKEADVILYDALVNTQLLDYAPKEAPRIFVGKRAGLKKFSQEEINELIVRCAFQYKKVVRLKGGDSFVFGRGFEEIEYAKSFGFNTEVVPGITSATSVPGSSMIPLTHRGISESFWVITATTRFQQLSADITLAAQSTATVVILMGVGKLHQIVEVFKSHNKNDLPIAIIQNGTTPSENSVVGVIDDIEEKVKLKKISSPAVIVVGEVVNLSAVERLKADHQQLFKNENALALSEAV